MWQQFFELLANLENFLWGYIGFPAIILMGFYLAYRSRLVQLRKFPHVVKTFLSFLTKKEACSTSHGIPPIKTFFACIGGCVGIGNIVGITMAVQLGGPGALFWVWMTAIIGSLIKYSEVFLGVRYRVKSEDGQGYKGGPMYFLQHAFKQSWVSKLFCVLLCLYGVEIYQFSVMTSSISENFGFSKPYVALILLGLVLVAEAGGVKRVGAICGAIVPAFIIIYLGMGFYVLASCIHAIPQVIVDIFSSAFTPHAAVGAFAGSSLMLAISQGMRRSCYSSDIGVGYASIIHSESSAQNPARQASLAIFEVFLDIFVICTMSIVLVLVTGTWTLELDSMFLVQTALGQFFPYMNFFIPLFLFMLGYSTVITYFCAGMKTALFLSPRFGRPLYYLYSVLSLIVFSFVDTTQANTVMMCVLAGLLILNLAAIFRLRKEISFDFAPKEENVTVEKLAATQVA
jgi:alanine or glycine:cation symporter, AGCS family